MNSQISVLPGQEGSALHVDLYELTMAAGYYMAGRKDEIAHFELFIRSLLPHRKYYIFCGLEAVLEYLENWHFSGDDIYYLKHVPALSHLPDDFFDYLACIRFTGDIFAFPEGSVVFPMEPLIRVCAPIIQAQLLETALLALVNHQTTVATKAARVVHAADGRTVVEFGARRAHGLGAAAWGARAAVIAGCSSTSNCYAGKRFGLDVVGTIAHSWIMSFDNEEEAFDVYADAFPDGLLLLIDTYETLEGAKLATKYGSKLRGVRLDSGDIVALSKDVRKILDDGGCEDAMIFASGDLNEYKIAELLKAGAPIDAFGVGSEMITSRDEPTLGGVYKLIAIEDADGRGISLKRKLSTSKVSLPGPKQVGRIRNDNGQSIGDVICLDDEEMPSDASTQIKQFVAGGIRIREAFPTFVLKAYAASDLAKFNAKLKDTDDPYNYPVKLSPKLAALTQGEETSIHVLRK